MEYQSFSLLISSSSSSKRGENAPGRHGYPIAAEVALEEEGLAIVPGGAFGDDRCVRLSCAVSRETIADGLSRLARLLAAG